MAGLDVETNLQIYKAALYNEWDKVSVLFRDTPELKTKTVNDRLETPLMIAVGTNRSHKFVEELLKGVRLLDNEAKEKWCGVNYLGNNALHYAAMVGNIIDAKLIMECLPAMKNDLNEDGDIPAVLAAKLGRGDMIHNGVFNEYIVLDEGKTAGVNLIIPAIQTGLLYLALMIIHLIIEPTEDKITANALRALAISDLEALVTNALAALANKPELFPSGNRLGFSGGFIYQSIKNIQDIKIKNEQSHQIVKKLCQMMVDIIIRKQHQGYAADARNMIESAIAKAVKYGIYELIEDCAEIYPYIIWYEYEGYNLFHLAIKERQVQVYNLVYQMSGYKQFVADLKHGDDNALHIAAKLDPSHQPSTITCAALLLQRELQWYKEVETFVKPEDVKALSNGKTPWTIFMDEHKELLKEGQQWMKDTTTSCTVVAALIVTITFAAAITAPGGNKDDGKPVFLNERAFMLFMMSDAFALFSSSTSLLMFLGILTSRYAAIDFLYAFPKRLMIGLMFLFLSITATMIAFGATIALLLHDKVTWIAPLLHDKMIWITVPVVMITSIPVGLCGSLQFRLLVELVWSTYGPSIFGKQGSLMFH